MSEQDKELAAIGAAIHRAAQKLPHGWDVVIEVSKHSGAVQLIDPDGETCAFPTNHERMSEEINDAIDYAILVEDRE